MAAATETVPSPFKRRLIWIGVAVLALGLGAVFYRDLLVVSRQNPNAARLLGRPIPVRAEPARMEVVGEVIGANAEVEPISFAKVPSRVTGVVEKVYVDVGELVRTGQLLAEMEPVLPEAAQRAAQAEVTKAQTELEIARLQFNRISELFREKIISQVTLDEAKLQMAVAEARLVSAQENYKKARIDATLGTRITSPITGVVQERMINPGESIREERQDFFRVGRIDDVAVVAKVAEEKIPSIKLGQTAEVIVDAFPNEVLTGIIVKIDPTVDTQNRSFKTYVKVANPGLRIRPGLSAYVRVRHQGFALTVPRLAVMTNAGQASVFVVEGDRARLRPVKTQPAGFGRVAVTEGLREGDVVVYYQLYDLEDNDRIQLEAVAAPKPAA